MKKRNKKIITVLLIIAVIISLIFVAKKIYYSTLEISPYDIYLRSENTNQEIKVSAYSYHWQDKGMYVIADGMISLEMQPGDAILNVKPNEKIYFTDYDVEAFSAAIMLKSENGNLVRVTVDCDEENNYIVVPNLIGMQTLGLYLTCENGYANYSAKINISE